MTMLQHGLVPSTGGYQIERSLRFNSADSAYLNRTPASAGNRQTWTLSMWTKRSNLSAATTGLFGAGSAGSTDTGIYWTSADKIDFFDRAGGTLQGYISTNAVFRDPSAWYHLVFVFDSTNATAANRMLIYVNNVLQSVTVNNTLPQNTSSSVNNTVGQNLGSLASASNFGNGYITEVIFIDGQALTPSSFGENDTDTGVWKPKAYTGSYGTNGFKLTFSDNSGTTATTLGKDTSGNGNNWTPNNFSVTAGAGNDSLVDTPTPYGTDTGAGGEVRGNYATMNPLANNGGTLANGNLDHTGTTAITTNTLFPTSGKWYCELTCTAYGGGGSFGYTAVGAIQSSQSINSIPNSLGNVPAGLWIYRNDANKANNGASASYGNTWTANDVIGIAIDIDAGKLWFAKNGTWQASGDPAAGTNAAYTNLSGAIGVAINDQGSYSSSYSCNFGQRPFAYTAPSGFKALCTTNLPTPTIGATSSTRADDYFNTVLYTGTGATRTVTGVGFQPDWVWIKSRSVGTYHHRLTDAVRGVTKEIYSNLTNAEGTDPNGLTAFGSDGFTLGSSNEYNFSGATFVAWNWKANGAGSSNTAGSITSTVSANTTAGFSIATYTGNSSNLTFGHGLGVAPAMYVIKWRSNTSQWYLYHKSLGAGKYLQLNLDAGAVTDTAIWQNTAPTSSLIYVGSGIVGTNTAVCYAFAEVAGYSAFGSYTGNGSADGPFVYTGFRPAFILVKCSSTGSTNWFLWDNKINSYNVASTVLLPNSSGAELGSRSIDILSNGFKCRANDSNFNGSGDTYVYAAFAEVPAKFSLAR